MEDFGLLKEKLSISEAVLGVAKENLRRTAITYLGRKISYKKLYKKVIDLSLAFYSMGVRKGDVVLVVLPNIPQAVFVLYALNRIGAIPAFVSPLAAEYELEEYIKKCKTKVIISLESLYEKFIGIFNRTGLIKLVLTSVFDEIGFNITRKKENAVLWSELFKLRLKANVYLSPSKVEDTAVILFSGGTTGKPKAVEITNLNLNSLATGTESACCEEVRGVKMLSVLPVFHGFGLGICVHTVLYFGGDCILVPRFESENAGRIIKKQKPQYLAVVPAMLSPLMNSKAMIKADLSELLGVFSGGDSLSAELQETFNNFLLKHNASVRIRQGYGLTECVASSCLMPADSLRLESIGKPYHNTMYKIVKKNTQQEAEKGTIGEICISGKTVMKGYYNDETETQNVLKTHADGRVWLHTGDMGYMDEEGFVYFKGRIKRIIISKGNNIFPSEIEKALIKNKAVKECCVVGIKDKAKAESAVAFAVMNNKDSETKETKEELLEYLKKYVSKQAMPKNIYFADEIPKTHLGKVKYDELIKIAEKKTADSY